MKNLFLMLAFMLAGTFAFGNILNDNIIIQKIEVCDYEFSKNTEDRYVYKQYLNKDKSGYRFFVPFFEDSSLQNTTISSEILGDDIILNYSEGGNKTMRKFSNFTQNSDGSISFDISTDKGTKTQANVFGENLNVESFKDLFSNLTDENLISQDCPPCVVGIAAAIVVACSDARNRCNTCKEGHKVSGCSCSCERY